MANVELVKSDAAAYVFPSSVAGKISTFALTLVPQFDEVVRNGTLALLPGKRFVILDFKRPSGSTWTTTACRSGKKLGATTLINGKDGHASHKVIGTYRGC